LCRLYKGCRYWKEAGGKQALRWAGERSEEFLAYAAKVRAASKPDYMPGPASLYRKWKEEQTTTSQVTIPVMTTVAILRDSGVTKVQVPTADLENQLIQLRKEHGDHAIRVVA
jgi:hypothetical protein